MIDMELLRELCTAGGISGDETDVRKLILDRISEYADEVRVDPLGSIIAFKKGKQRPARRLMISAHMDEVGFIVTDITSSGMLKFECVGGINDSAVFARQVLVGKDKLPGVVCSKPIHLLKSDEKGKNPPPEALVIDIGARDREQALEHVRPGDSIIFDSIFDSNDGRIISKAIDDRFGCLVLIEMLRSELPYDMYFCFCVQEEVGLRGSAAAAFSVAPDSAIVIEATTAADIPGNEGESRVCCVGGGAVVSFMDRSTIYDKEYYELAMKLAKDNNIPAQTKTKIAGGNDAGAIHRSRGGVRTIAVSVPCRYLHAASSLIRTDDAQAVRDLVGLLSERICAG